MVQTRIFFATDIHGSEKCFLKFISSAKFYKADIIILGGDITGKMIIPVIRQPDSTFLLSFSGENRVIKSLDELEAVKKNIRSVGYYPYCTNLTETNELKADKGKLDELFSRLMIESLKELLSNAKDRLQGTNTKCFITPGNDDRFVIDSVLDESDYLINPEGKVVEIDRQHEMISTGWSNPTPWHSQRECEEHQLATKIESMASKVKDMRNCVFNIHCPPYNSMIDSAPQLDNDLKPTVSGGQMIMVPAGSKSVRNAIQAHQPLLGLHGHIHESRGIYKLGRTLCLNPGSEYTEGILRGVIVNLNEKGVKSHLFTSG